MSVRTGIDPLRLDEIDRWNGSMLAALDEAHADRWDRRDEMLRTLILRVDTLVRWQAVRHGENHEDPGAITVLRPGETPPPPSWVQALRGM